MSKNILQQPENLPCRIGKKCLLFASGCVTRFPPGAGENYLGRNVLGPTQARGQGVRCVLHLWVNLAQIWSEMDIQKTGVGQGLFQVWVLGQGGVRERPLGHAASHAAHVHHACSAVHAGAPVFSLYGQNDPRTEIWAISTGTSSGAQALAR